MHHYNSTQYCKTETVFSTYPFLWNSTKKCTVRAKYYWACHCAQKSKTAIRKQNSLQCMTVSKFCDNDLTRGQGRFRLSRQRTKRWQRNWLFCVKTCLDVNERPIGVFHTTLSTTATTGQTVSARRQTELNGRCTVSMRPWVGVQVSAKDIGLHSTASACRGDLSNCSDWRDSTRAPTCVLCIHVKPAVAVDDVLPLFPAISIRHTW